MFTGTNCSKPVFRAEWNKTILKNVRMRIKQIVTINLTNKMKKTYDKLSTDLLIIENEGSFMSCSVRVNSRIVVHEYDTFEFAGTDGYKTEEWTLGFDE